ncbi:MAG: T9SS type A sorting domain-containing protein [Bacteroidota bacterium]
MARAFYTCSIVLFTLTAVSVSAQNCLFYPVVAQTLTEQQVDLRNLLYTDLAAQAHPHGNSQYQPAQQACITQGAQNATKSADDPLGTVNRERWEDATQSWRPDELTEFIYDEMDRLDEANKSRWSVGNQIWLPVSKNKYLYNGATREIVTSAWNGTTFINTQREITSRDTVANSTTVRSEDWVANAWQVTSVTTSIDEDDLLQEAQTTLFQFGSPVATTRLSASYDELNRNTRWLFEDFNENTSQWDTTGQQITIYTDSSATLLAQAYLGINQWETVFTLTSQFNDRGLVEILTREFFQPFPSINRTVFAYEAGHNNPISIINQFLDLVNVWTNDEGDFITHDADGDILVRLNQLYNQVPGSAGTWLNIKRDTFTYEPTTTATETATPMEFAVDIFPNPANTPITINLSTTEPASVEIAVFDILGRQVAALREAAPLTGAMHLNWDTSAHPAGLYFVRLRFKDRVHSYPVTLLP